MLDLKADGSRATIKSSCGKEKIIDNRYFHCMSRDRDDKKKNRQINEARLRHNLNIYWEFGQSVHSLWEKRGVTWED